MADEILKIDANNKSVSGAVTDNASQEIRMLRIDDATKGLKVIIVGGAGAGTVTSISASTGILLTPNPITTTGTVGLATNIAPIATLGTAGQSIRVNAGATALEYYTPSASSGLTVGTTTIASGTTTRILYDNAGVLGEYTLTGTGTVVAMQTAPSFLTSITTPSVLATANDSGAIGASGTAFSDVFLASGAVINFNAGNMTLTHAAGSLTFAGGNVLALGATTATTFNGLTITANGTNTLNISAGKTVVHSAGTTFAGTDGKTLTISNSGTLAGGDAFVLAIAAAKTFTVSNTLTLAGTDSTVMTFPTTSATIARTDAGQTFTGVQTMTSPSITTANLTGAQQLAENASIQLDPAGSADGKYTGITVTATSGYTQAFGDLVYLDPTDSRWEQCDANSAQGADGDSRGLIGMVVVTGTDGNACTILLNGIIRADAKFPTFTVNNPIYVSETAGAVTQTQPTTTDVVIRVVGFALTGDEMYFNPSGDYITHI